MKYYLLVRHQISRSLLYANLVALVVVQLACSTAAQTRTGSGISDSSKSASKEVSSSEEKIVRKYLELALESRMSELAKLVRVEAPARTRASSRNAEGPSYDIVVQMTRTHLLLDFPTSVASSSLTPSELVTIRKSAKMAKVRLKLVSGLDKVLSKEAVFDLEDIGKGDWRITFISTYNSVGSEIIR